MKRIAFVLMGLVIGVTAPVFVAQDEGKPKKAPTPAKKLEKLDSHDSALAEKIDGLVGQLGAEEFSRRDAAWKALKKLGPKARPYLQRHLDAKDPEVRQRVKSLLESLEPAKKPETRPRSPGGIDVRPLPGPPRPDQFPNMEEYWRALDAWMESRFRGLGRGFEIEINPDARTHVSSSTTMNVNGTKMTWKTGSDGCRFTVTTKDGATRTYEAKDLEEFKTLHPEVYERYKDTGVFENGRIRFQLFGPGQGLGSPPLPPLPGENDLRKEFEERFKRLRRLFDGATRRPDTRRLRRLPDAEKEGTGSDARRAPKTKRLGVLVSRTSDADELTGFDGAKVGAPGVYIHEVDAGSLAEKLGLKAGDVLLFWNAAPIASPDDLARLFHDARDGASLELMIWRKGKVSTLKGRMPGPRPRRKLKKI